MRRSLSFPVAIAVLLAQSAVWAQVHTIQAATAYKVVGEQLYWQDRDNREHHVPLSSVDVPFSQQINRDRRVDFQIR